MPPSASTTTGSQHHGQSEGFGYATSPSSSRLRNSSCMALYSAETRSNRESEIARPLGHASDVGFGEIIAFEEEGLARRAGKRVGEQVAEIEACGVTSLAE